MSLLIIQRDLFAFVNESRQAKQCVRHIAVLYYFSRLYDINYECSISQENSHVFTKVHLTPQHSYKYISELFFYKLVSATYGATSL